MVAKGFQIDCTKETREHNVDQWHRNERMCDSMRNLTQTDLLQVRTFDNNYSFHSSVQWEMSHWVISACRYPGRTLYSAQYTPTYAHNIITQHIIIKD